MTTTTNGQPAALDDAQVTNDAEHVIVGTAPYIVTFTIEGTAAMLFHRWSCDDVEAKQKAAKNSTTKKQDNVEAYVYRDDDGQVCLPGEYVRMAMVETGRYRQDPRSPRKSARDLYKAAFVPLTEMSPVMVGQASQRVPATTWDYLDRRRVTVQRNGVTRARPAFLAGWRATFDFQVIAPEYLAPADFLDVLNQAGRLVGVGDFRPTYGRFQVLNFDVELP